MTKRHCLRFKQAGALDCSGSIDRFVNFLQREARRLEKDIYS